MCQVESGWVGICRGVERVIRVLHVALKGGGVQEEGVGGCGWAGVLVAYRYIEYEASAMIAYLESRLGCVRNRCPCTISITVPYQFLS
jgi:hypothetical protein